MISDTAPGDQRESFLDRACGEDQELRQRVSRLVQVQPKIEEYLERPFAGPATIAELPGPCEGAWRRKGVISKYARKAPLREAFSR